MELGNEIVNEDEEKRIETKTADRDWGRIALFT